MKPFKCLFLVLAVLTTFFVEGSLPSYNLTISDTHQFVWFRVAKVGTRSILHLLNENQVPFAVNDYEVPYDKRDYEGYFKFAFVRNPWDRVVSCYCNKVVSKGHKAFSECFDKDFDFFVNYISRQDLKHADAHIRLQTSLIPVKEMDFIGRMENFDEDLTAVMNTIGIEAGHIPRNNATQHVHYSHYYNERTRKIIAEVYKRDIKAFGYQFENE